MGVVLIIQLALTQGEIGEIVNQKQILARIAKLCKENIDAFGENYDPKFPNGRRLTHAKAEGYGVASFAKEILMEIKAIRRELRKIKI